MYFDPVYAVYYMILTLLTAATFQLIDRVMKEDLAEVHSKKQHPKKDGKRHGYFEEVIFSVADWQAMRDLLDILTVSTSFLHDLHILHYTFLIVSFILILLLAIQDIDPRNGGGQTNGMFSFGQVCPTQDIDGGAIEADASERPTFSHG
jgi:hypothetical protein